MSSGNDKSMSNPWDAVLRELHAKGEVPKDVLYNGDAFMRWWKSLDPTKQDIIIGIVRELSQGQELRPTENESDRDEKENETSNNRRDVIIPITLILLIFLGISWVSWISGIPQSLVSSWTNRIPQSSDAVKTPTNTELQNQVAALQQEVNQLREQEKAEVLQKAKNYYAIVEFIVGGSSEPTGIQPLTVDAIVSSLTTSSKVWGLIRATEDPYLMSTCQPDKWGQIPVSYSYIKNYAEGKYRELMSKYYSQLYIDEQLYKLEQARQETIAQAEQAAKEEDGKPGLTSLPFTYTGKGSGRTPAFRFPSPTEPNCKLTFTATWDGDISLTWYLVSSPPFVVDELMWRSSGISFGFPESVEAGKTYEYILGSMSTGNTYFIEIGNVPADGEWTVTVSQMDVATPRPKVDITMVIEYEGDWVFPSSSWVLHGDSGNKSIVHENIRPPFSSRVRKSDEGVGPLVLKITYNGEIVTQDTAIGEDDEAYVFWEGPR